MQKLILPTEIFPSLNKIIDLSKQHWSKYKKLKEGLTLAVKAEAKQQLQPIINYPVKLKIHWIMPNKRRDPSNISASIKFIEDGLVTAGILKDDGFDEIKSIKHYFSFDKVNPKVEVTIIS
jgi:Holliday junction resolvase RusA-like endonuclease